MALTYSELAFQSKDEAFIQRVEFALLQDVNANRLQAETPALTSVTMEDQRDRLGRSILADPHGWAVRFARVVAVQLIGKKTMADEKETTDGDIFAACSAVFDKFLPQV